ncbi:hypothetical protein E3P89_00616 [Wallemia ichthyophaga]|uniref:Homoserine dehydrogenase n=1 Tax=Wallemia ichthyophaga TaxID=245174 RepID=A0A4T0HIF0_WALIC|nr:hypothetical protein E3P91_00639 [Wallemia ichthyophaga]TIA83765.1 hypothetical protein E3P98_00629 [Wallemia ichthyophaga]TIB15756.1 hypothetical protein E3P90_00775 [Wallemia ichthyophaga]TIB17739.1 hypothetical protein E3P93_00632 [Wallemia ichthyophaga]TIB25253.1 hypothetical protein E3P89_00616 [Wallemia ichthyophaga]
MVLFNAAQSTQKTVNVALIGPGGVGSCVLEQLSKLSQFKLISISNSKATYFNPSGIPFHSAKADLSKATPKSIEKELIPQLSQHQPCIFIDNTSSDAVASLYPVALSHGVHVVTPNKVGFSASLSLFNHIRDASAASGAYAYKESTVGAGLPVISTLETLLKTGDKVTKIEGVLSGTMSYLFNTFSKPGTNDDILFSKLVSDARDQGYTEPHPASDLSGSDVARKLAILSRLVPGLENRLEEGVHSVDVESLIPPGLDGDTTPEEFLSGLKHHDAHYESLRKTASDANSVLRYVGVVDTADGTVKCGLETYPASHPLASLSGSDNIFLFHTQRYGARPLIVQGAGAGSDVTAMGVVGDCISIAERV